jgi:hypothetical protein
VNGRSNKVTVSPTCACRCCFQTGSTIASSPEISLATFTNRYSGEGCVFVVFDSVQQAKSEAGVALSQSLVREASSRARRGQLPTLLHERQGTLN